MKAGTTAIVAAFCFMLAAQPAGSTLGSATTGDDERVARGFQYLLDLQSGKALGQLTAPYIEAVAARDRARASRYMLLIANAFRLDENHIANLACCRQAELLDPDNLQAKTMTVDALVRCGRLTDAEEHLKPLLPQAESQWLVARSLAGLYVVEGDVDNAHKFAVIASKLNPDDTRAHVTLARLNFDKEAIEQWKKAAATTQSSYLQKIYLCQAELKEHPNKPDMSALDEAARLLPDEPSWRTTRAWQLQKAGKEDEAYDLMVQSVACPRLYQRAFTQLAAFCLFHKRPKIAARAVNYLEKLHPYSPDVYFALGVLASDRGDLEARKADYLKALELNPKQNDAYVALSSLNEYRRDTATSRELAERWLKNSPFMAEAWVYRARLASHRGQWQAALDDYESARQKLHSSEGKKQSRLDVWLPVASGAGTCRYELGNKDEALKNALLFNQLKPESDALMRVRPGKIAYDNVQGKAKTAAEHALLADMLYETGRLDECIAEYKLAIDAHDNVEWHRGLLKAYMDNHNYSAAAKEDLIVANHAVTSDIPQAAERLGKQFLR
jgi:tetratricopeptide (TPR) repeat protein